MTSFDTDQEATDYEIAQSVEKESITDVVESFGLEPSDLELFGEYKAKVKLDSIERVLDEREADGKLILVTGMTPTPMGEGKTVTTVGLGQAFNQIDKETLIAIREPSLGPVFGVKGEPPAVAGRRCCRWRISTSTSLATFTR